MPGAESWGNQWALRDGTRDPRSEFSLGGPGSQKLNHILSQSGPINHNPLVDVLEHVLFFHILGMSSSFSIAMLNNQRVS